MTSRSAAARLSVGAIVEKQCAACPNRFRPSGNRRYCSASCRYPKKICPICGGTFTGKNVNTKTYCSKPCAVSTRDMAALRALVRSNRGGKPRQKDCARCGTSFAPRSSRQRFCGICVADSAGAARLRRYGVTSAQWKEMIARFDGRCWICHEQEATCVDHDHASGAVRGALCRACNMALHYVENAGWMTRARGYLEGGDADATP